MKLIYNYVLLLVFSSCAWAVPEQPINPVPLAHFKELPAQPLEINVPGGYVLYSATNPGKKKSIQKDLLRVTADALGNLIINDTNSHTHTIIAVPADYFKIHDASFTGRLLITTLYEGLALVVYKDTKSSLASLFAQAQNKDALQQVCARKSVPDTAQPNTVQADIVQTKGTEDKQENTVATSPEKATSYNVRVLLDEQTMFMDPWQLSAQDGFIIADPHDARHTITIPSSTLEVSERRGSFYLNNKKYLREQVLIKPRTGYLMFEGSPYEGSFLLVRDKDKRLLINQLDLEQYVAAVLKSEVWPGWPAEVNKACAIASRTYAIGMVQRSHTNKLPYHIKNTNVHQVYEGLHTSPELKKATQETQGIFLAYKEQPILAMFDSCCGGVIPAHIQDFNFKRAPYLARTYPCTYCKPYKVYRWQARYTNAELLTLLKDLIPNSKKIRNITIAKKDKAGLVTRVAIHTNKGITHVPGKKIYSLLPHVKSFCFTITKEGNSFVFNGRGYGHHIGLCQWGARGMAAQGFGYKDILKFYYPGTSFMRLH